MDAQPSTYRAPAPSAKEHADRVRMELVSVGMTSHGLSKSETRYLPQLIGYDEHVGGVVYGLSSIGSAMLVATNERLIYLDRKPFFTLHDDIRYEGISGVRLSQQGPITSITVHARIHDFTLKYVNANCASIFEQYVSERCLENPQPYRAIRDLFRYD